MVVLPVECYSGLGELGGYNMQTNPSYNTSAVSQSTTKPRPYTVSYSNPMFDNYGDLGGSGYKSTYDYNNRTVRTTGGDLGLEGGSYYSPEGGSSPGRHGTDAAKKRYQSSKPVVVY